LYYYEIKAIDELVGEDGVLRIPEYSIEEFVMDETRKTALKTTLDLIRKGENVLITGVAGSGKTALMALILKKILDYGGRIAMILEGANIISREHEEKGIILFYDDIPRMRTDALTSIFKNNVKGIIATARVEEIPTVERKIGFRFDSHFNIVRVPLMDKEHLKEMLKRYISREGIRVAEQEAMDIVAEKAQGLPVYVWQVIRELRILKKPLTIEFAKLIPEGMLEYVDDILWRVLDEDPERYEVLLTLLIMSDMKRYAIHQDLFNYVFLVAKERRLRKKISIEEALFSTLLDRITRYLARESATYSFRLPHDSWGDVLKGKSSGPMSGEISRINTIYPPQKRREIVIEAVIRAWNESVKDSEDPRRNAFLDFIKLNLGDEFIRRLVGVKEYVLEERPKAIEKEMEKVKPVRAQPLIMDVFELLKSYRQTGNRTFLDEAISKLHMMDTPEARYGLGIAHYLRGDYEQAEKYFKKVVKMIPKARLGLALIKLVKGDIKSALKEISEYIKTNPKDTVVSSLYVELKNGFRPLYKLLFEKE